MNRNDFVARFGGIYEDSPWVAEMVWDVGRANGHDSTDSLARAMATAVDTAPLDKRLTLLRAHPDLAGRAALAGELSAASASEQSGAGLDHCMPGELAEFQRLNAAYKAKFGFPFIIAVAGLHRLDILAAFRRRVENDPDVELATAMAEAHKIARLRLEALVAGP